MSRKIYHYLAMGGSFDHFHDGHKHFIDFAANLADKLFIGVSSDKLTKSKKLPHLIEPYRIRKKAVIHYCREKGINCLVDELNDVYGPTIEDKNVDALCVTQESVVGAKQINDLRQNLNLRTLPVHFCDWLKDEDDEILSSTRIREGKVSRSGQVYESVLRRTLVLNPKQREFFSEPQGQQLTTYTSTLLSADNLQLTTDNYVVGDVTLDIFLDHNCKYNLAVYDKKSKRIEHVSRQISQIKPDLTCVNQAGEISLQLTESLQKCLESDYKHLFIEGEEDVATLALVLLLPLGSRVYYGQPNEGVIEITINEKVKESFFEVLSNIW